MLRDNPAEAAARCALVQNYGAEKHAGDTIMTPDGGAHHQPTAPT